MALELPADVRRMLADWALALADAPGAVRPPMRMRPVRPESLHVTLCFLGAQSVTSIDAIAAAISSGTSSSGTSAGTPPRPLPAPLLTLGDPLWLPRRRPRVLAAELVEADEGTALARLQSAVSGALVATGLYEPEARPFLGHVTLARVSSLRGGEVAGPRPRTPPVPAPRWPGPFACRNVTLYRSRIGSGPARYEPLATVELAC